MEIYKFLTPEQPWPRDGVSGAGVVFEASTWYPLEIVYVPEGEKFSRAIIERGEQHLLTFGHAATIAMVREIPNGAEEFTEINGITLVQADWVQERFVVIGRGGCQTMHAGYEKWRKLEVCHA